MEIVYQDGQRMISRKGVIASVEDTERAIMTEINAQREIVTSQISSAKETVIDIVKGFKVTKVIDEEAESEFERARSVASASVASYSSAVSELSRLHLLILEEAN